MKDDDEGSDEDGGEGLKVARGFLMILPPPRTVRVKFKFGLWAQEAHFIVTFILNYYIFRSCMMYLSGR